MPEPLTRHQSVVPAAELLERGPDCQRLPGALRRAGHPELHTSNCAGSVSLGISFLTTHFSHRNSHRAGRRTGVQSIAHQTRVDAERG